MKRWPNFLIISSPKSGTTTIYEYLKNSSDVFMPLEKEPRFFSPSILPYGHSKPLSESEYLNLFKGSEEKIAIGEASTSYLIDPSSAGLIRKFIPSAKLIILLRDPVERVISEYLWNIRMGSEDENIENLISNDLKQTTEQKISTKLDGSLYSQKVVRYLQEFPKDQIEIIIFEEFVENIRENIIDVFNFLGLHDSPPDLPRQYNEFKASRSFLSKKIVASNIIAKVASRLIPSSSTRRLLREKLLEKKGTKPLVSIDKRKCLEKFYYEDIIKLEDILERNLPWFHLKTKS